MPKKTRAVRGPPISPVPTEQKAAAERAAEDFHRAAYQKAAAEQAAADQAAADQAEQIAIEQQVAVVVDTMVMDIATNASTPRSETSTEVHDDDNETMVPTKQTKTGCELLAALSDGISAAMIASHITIVNKVRMIILGLLILIFMALACMIFVFLTWYCLNQTLVVSMQRMHEENEALFEQNRQMNTDLLHFKQTLQQITLLAQAHNTSRVEPKSVLDTSRIEAAIAKIEQPVNVAVFAVTKIFHDRGFFELANAFGQPVAFVWTAGFWTAYNFIDEETTEWLFNSLQTTFTTVGGWIESGVISFVTHDWVWSDRRAPVHL
jgi:hypothetical protein